MTVDADTVRPPIPATCESRPTIAGVVIPWINVRLADGGVDFRSQHNATAQRSFREGRCQVCATLIDTPPFVFLGGPRQVSELQFDEPPLHPACAVYVSRACPMVAGRLEHFAGRDPISAGRRGEVCPDPGCDCGGFVPTPGTAQSAAGRPAHDWYAVYASGYSLGVTAERPDHIHAAVLSPSQALAVRHVSTPGIGRTWQRTSLAQVGGDGT